MFKVKVKVAVLHPETKSYDPEALYVAPLTAHVYELPQAVTDSLPVVVTGFTVKFKVAMLHPSSKVTPDCAVVYDCPLAGQT